MSGASILRLRAEMAGVLVVAAVAMLPGCGPRRPATTQVTGSVVLDGKPLAGALVLFQPTTGMPARAVTDDAGGFMLTTFSSGDGATVGLHRVAVSKVTMSGVQADESGLSGPAAPGGLKQTWVTPQKYASPAESGLEIEVTQGMGPVMLELRSR